MRIVIKDENKTRINDILEAVQHGCRARCINYETIKTTMENETKRFSDRGVSKAARNGSIFAFTEGADIFPSTYHGRPYGTYYEIEFTKTGANLVCVDRIQCNAKYLRRIVTLSDTAKEALAKAF